MPNTYVALATQTLGSTASTVTFSSIPSGYTDLVLQCSLRADTSTFNNMNYPLLRFNGDSTSGLYSVTGLYARNTGGGDTANSTRSSSQNEINSGGIATSAMASGIFSTYQIQLQNYASTSVFKTVLARIGTGGNLTALDGTWASVGLWRNTNAITSLSLTATSSGSFQIGSTFSLYGIANADQGIAKATGGIITEDSQYWYHTFGASSAFIPKQSLTCDVLVVAGGGGGGGVGNVVGSISGAAGGGGAGGLRALVSQSLIATSYPITIGAGASGGGAGFNRGANGSNTTFDATTSTGGGGGGSNYNGSGTNAGMSGNDGGSGGGGGGSGRGADTGTGGAASPSGQGNIGGTTGGNRGASGGGGSATAGGSAVGDNLADPGGNGLDTYSSWSTVTSTGVVGRYAAGGGGGGWDGADFGAGGLGGAGNGGSNSNNGANAITNTGSGGGGAGARASGTTVGGNGGSGVVIVRYLKA